MKSTSKRCYWLSMISYRKSDVANPSSTCLGVLAAPMPTLCSLRQCVGLRSRLITSLHFANLIAVKILKLANDELDTLVVTSAGNRKFKQSQEPSAYPAMYLSKGYMDALVCVGSTDGNSRRAASSRHWANGVYPRVEQYAPGEGMYTPIGKSGSYITQSGTSISMRRPYPQSTPS